MSRGRDYLLTNAKELLQKAKVGAVQCQRLKSTRYIGLTNFISNESNVYVEEEIKLYIDTAEVFRACSRWADAAEAYAQAAWIMGNHLKQNEEAAILYTEAGLSAMKLGIYEAQRYFKQAVSYYCDGENLLQAGRIHNWIAKGYEDSDEIVEAIKEYELTLKYFKAEGTLPDQELTCERKIAQLLCLCRNFEEASVLYQMIGMKELQNNLTKYKAHLSFFKSLVLLLPGALENGKPYDFTEVKGKMKWAVTKDFRFEVSAPCDFVHNIILMLVSKKGNTLHVFMDHVYDYDSVYPLDPTCLNIMEEIIMLHYSDQLEECSKRSYNKMNLN